MNVSANQNQGLGEQVIEFPDSESEAANLEADSNKFVDMEQFEGQNASPNFPEEGKGHKRA